MKTLLTFLLTVTAAFSVEQADVIVGAATHGVVAAAVSAARSGSSVNRLEEKIAGADRVERAAEHGQHQDAPASPGIARSS